MKNSITVSITDDGNAVMQTLMKAFSLFCTYSSRYLYRFASPFIGTN